MRQAVGFLLIISCFLLFIFISNGIQNEYIVAKQHETQIEEKIELPEIKNPLPIKMVDQNGNVFSEEYTEWRQPVKMKDVPDVIQKLFIYSEDEKFYDHIGFDLSAIIRAFVVNSSEQSLQQGGSTITQQLVRMRYLSTEKTYERKLMEIFYAYRLEQKLDKETIFEMYLNETYYGNQVYGIGAAATYYFQKTLSELSIPQLAFIAAIPNNPTFYDPIQHFDHTKARQERLLDLLATHNVISKQDAKNYKAEPIKLNIKEKIQKFPSYSTYVLEELKELIAYQEGYEEQLKTAKTEEEKETIQTAISQKINELSQSGIIIYTALDANKQLKDQKNIDSILKIPNLQASATVIDNHTREIVSIYGGKNYKKYDLHRAFQAPRQPGSSFKPLLVYAPLFENTDYTPNSIINGGKYCVGNYCPQNYGGAIYGDVTVSTAFRNSYNTPALRLLHTVGLENAFQYIDQFQFSTIVPEDRNYAASLGGLKYGVTTLEMADAYTSFIDGSYIPAKSIRQVTDLEGNVIYSWPKERKNIWSNKTVDYMRSLLHDVVTNGTGKGLHTHSSYIGAKTGTTNDVKDLWLVGLTNEYTAAVWLGYDIPKGMEHLESNKIPFTIFNAIMN